jgi:hypothetical protein
MGRDEKNVFRAISGKHFVDQGGVAMKKPYSVEK